MAEVTGVETGALRSSQRPATVATLVVATGHGARLVSVIDPACLCAYCVTNTLTGSEKPEHPIPAALGAVSLTVPTTCDLCNEWAGREIDQPFLRDDLIRAHRSLVDQRDPRRGGHARRVASPLLRGRTAEGDYVAFDHELGRPVMGSRIVDLGGGRQEIRAGSEQEAARLLEKMRERAASAGQEIRVEAERRSQFRPEITAAVGTLPLV